MTGENLLKVVTVEVSNPEVAVHVPSAATVMDPFDDENRVRHLHVDPHLKSLVAEFG